MDWLDDRIRRRRQKPINEVRAWDRLGLRAAVALELGPDAGEGRERPGVIEGKPDHVLFLGLRVWLVRVFGEAVERD